MVLQIKKSKYFNLIFGNIESELDFINSDIIVIQKEFKKLIPIIYYRLKKKNLLNKLSTNILEKINNIYNTTLAHNLIYLNELELIKEEFNKNNINFILLKGIALLELELYKPGLRPMNDMDILISPESFQKGIKILKNINYNQFKNIIKSDHCSNLGKNIINIGLHREITINKRYYGVSSFNFDSLYKNSILINDYRILEPTTFFFHLLVHLTYSHGFVGLIQITDIIKFYFKFYNSIDFEKLNFLSKNNHVKVGVSQLINLLNKDFNLNIPYKYNKLPLIQKISEFGFNENFRSSPSKIEPHNIVPIFLSENLKDLTTLFFNTLSRKILRREM